MDFLFGSIAVMWAIQLLDTKAALITAVIGGSYTILLWSHPYALIIFSLEALIVSYIYQASNKNINLVIIDLAYWCFVGVPLVLYFYKYQISVPWNAALMIALKQTLNGVFNCIIASFVMVSFRLFSLKYTRFLVRAPKIGDVLFLLFLVLTFIAGAIPIVLYGVNLKIHKEKIVYIELENKVNQIQHILEKSRLSTDVKWSEILKYTDIDPQESISIYDSSQNLVFVNGMSISSKSDNWQSLNVNSQLNMWFPIENIAQMKRWLKGRYYIKKPLIIDKNKKFIIYLEKPAAPTIKLVEMSRLWLMFYLFILLLISIVISNLIIISLTKPLKRLALVSNNLAKNIVEGKHAKFPKLIVDEYIILKNSLIDMSENLLKTFTELQEIKNSLKEQVDSQTNELKYERERLEGILTGTNVGTWQWNIVTGETIFNERWAEMIGYSLAELAPISIDTWLNHTHKDDLKGSAKALKRHFSGEVNYYEYEARMQHKKGHWVWVLDRGKVLSWAKDGSPLTMSGTHQDITGKKKIEFELHNKLHYINAILNAASDVIITINKQGIIKSVNPATTKMFHYHSDELIGFNIEILTPAKNKESDSMSIASYLNDTPKNIGKYHDILGQKKDGSIINLELMLSELNVEDEVLFLGVLRDISERKEMEKLKRDFVSTVSHELRTPLTIILGYLPYLMNQDQMPKPALIADMATKMHRSGKNLLLIINDLLDISKIESGSFNLTYSTFEISELLKNIVSDFEKTILDHGLTLNFKSNSFQIEADSQRIKQILTNLISNAIKFTPNGNININVFKNSDDYISISIEDSGIGIEKSIQQDIFNRFKQVDSSNTRVGGGVGLGLAICKQFIELHNGQIFLESEIGKGSCFTILLPISNQNLKN